MEAVLQPSKTVAQESIRLPQPVARNIAVDAYRGFVMFLMMAEVLHLARVAAAYPRDADGRTLLPFRRIFMIALT